METAQLEQLKYPVGKYQRPDAASAEQIKSWMNDIATFPALLKKEVQPLSEKQLEWTYRPEGWTIRQVVHHCFDSHVNAFVRFKLALTEESPTIKPYNQDKWAALPDGNQAPVEWSLQMIDALHKRWVFILQNMQPADFERTYFHPEGNRNFKLYEVACLYAWHCRQHLAHVKQAVRFEGKF